MITKAIIPVAGRGRRMHPITLAMAKAMLPLPSGPDRTVPVVHLICAEAATAGIDELLLVVSPEHRSMFEDYFGGLSDSERADLPGRIELDVQMAPKGFGSAVGVGREFVGDDTFMLLLGDHVYLATDGQKSCAAQVASAYGQYGGVAMVGVQSVNTDELARVGVVAGDPISLEVYRCRDYVEKPTPQVAIEHLKTPGLGEGEFLGHCGIYVFTPEIFGFIASLEKGGGVVELAAAQCMLLKANPQDYLLCRIQGRARDIGSSASYIETFKAMADE